MVILWIGFAVLTAIVASNAGKSVWAWSALGFLFGPFALAAVWFIGRE